jgi:succinate dehydrogenase / fumarate reductase, membrane anchor subunit
MTDAFRYYYLRVTGLLMVALVFIHLFIMHYASAPSATNAGFVAARWAASGWRAFDWALLLLALTHGLAGVNGMLREVVRRAGARAALDAAAVASAAGFVALGTAAVIAGAPPHHNAGPLSSGTWIPAVLIGGLVVTATVTYAGLGAAGAVLMWRLARHEPIGRWNYPGQWAFALNRVAGAGLLAFLLVHVVDVALFPFAPALYDRTVAAYAMPYLVPMEAGLVAAVVYHALDGLRLMMLEALDRRGEAAGVPSFVAILLLTASLSLPAVVVLLGRR